MEMGLYRESSSRGKPARLPELGLAVERIRSRVQMPTVLWIISDYRDLNKLKGHPLLK